jgi:hypothetical protein
MGDLAFGVATIGQSAASAQQAQGKAVEDFSIFAGRWSADPPFPQREGPKPRFVNTLVIGVTPSENTIDREYSTASAWQGTR